MYNDVDMVWLADPFPYMEGYHDVYFTDDMTPVRSSYLPYSLSLMNNPFPHSIFLPTVI